MGMGTGEGEQEMRTGDEERRRKKKEKKKKKIKISKTQTPKTQQHKPHQLPTPPKNPLPKMLKLSNPNIYFLTYGDELAVAAEPGT